MPHKKMGIRTTGYSVVKDVGSLGKRGGSSAVYSPTNGKPYKKLGKHKKY